MNILQVGAELRLLRSNSSCSPSLLLVEPSRYMDPNSGINFPITSGTQHPSTHSRHFWKPTCFKRPTINGFLFLLCLRAWEQTLDLGAEQIIYDWLIGWLVQINNWGSTYSSWPFIWEKLAEVVNTVPCVSRPSGKLVRTNQLSEASDENSKPVELLFLNQLPDIIWTVCLPTKYSQWNVMFLPTSAVVLIQPRCWMLIGGRFSLQSEEWRYIISQTIWRMS